MTPTVADVSVVILTRNPGPALRQTLESVAWAREVIAVDADSRDGTLECLRAYGAIVMGQDDALVREHQGNFDIARNAGLARARSRWVLVLDADEVVSGDLRDEMLAVTANSATRAYEIPRTNLYWGRPSRVLGNDRQVRLFPHGQARHVGTALDQPLQVDCPIHSLTHPILHHQRRLLSKLRHRTDQRARRAAQRGDVGAASVPRVFVDHLRWYIIRQEAWRDGPRGLALAALYSAYPALETLKTRRLVRTRQVEGE